MFANAETDRKTVELRDYWLTIRRRWMVVIATLLATRQRRLPADDPGHPAVLVISAHLRVTATASDDPGAAYSGNLFATQRVTSIVDFVTTRDLSEVVASNLGGDVAAAEARAVDLGLREARRPPTSSSRPSTPTRCSRATSRRVTPRR